MLQTQFVIYNPPPRHTKLLAPTYRKNLINSVVSFARNPHFLAQPSPEPVTTSLIRRTLNPMGVSDIGDPKIVPGTRNSRNLKKNNIFYHTIIYYTIRTPAKPQRWSPRAAARSLLPPGSADPSGPCECTTCCPAVYKKGVFNITNRVPLEGSTGATVRAIKRT